MRVAFAALPEYGHAYPLVPLALATCELGYDVTFACGPPVAGALPLTTVPNQPAELSIKKARAATVERLATQSIVSRPVPQPGSLEFGVEMFGRTLAPTVRATLRERWMESRPDVVIWESMNVGAPLAARDLGIPAVPFAITLTNRYMPALLAAAGLERPGTVLDPFPDGWRLDDPPIGARRVAIQSRAWNMPRDIPRDWSTAVWPRPRIYVTLGTVFSAWGGRQLLGKVIGEVAELNADVLVATGPSDEPFDLDVGQNVHAETFVDQASVLRRADVIVHHGGSGTLMAAFECGVPQVVVPVGSDQFMNAERLMRLSLGEVVRSTAQEGEIAAAANRALSHDRDATGVTEIREQIAAAPTPSAIASQLSTLLERAF